MARQSGFRMSDRQNGFGRGEFRDNNSNSSLYAGNDQRTVNAERKRVLRSAWIPPPPPLSDRAMVRAIAVVAFSLN